MRTLLGFIGERHIESGKISAKLTAADVMTDPVTTTLDTPLSEALQKTIEANIDELSWTTNQRHRSGCFVSVLIPARTFFSATDVTLVNTCRAHDVTAPAQSSSEYSGVHVAVDAPRPTIPSRIELRRLYLCPPRKFGRVPRTFRRGTPTSR